MNRYLTKIAELIKKDLPYRDRVEILVVKEGKVLLTRNRNKETGETWRGLPGGGVDGLTEQEACRNECLEEVGVRIKNLRKIPGTFKQEGGMSKKNDRHLKYRGSITTWYLADYDGIDRSKLGDDGDSRQYSWETPFEAHTSFRDGKAMGKARADALKASRAL